MIRCFLAFCFTVLSCSSKHDEGLDLALRFYEKNRKNPDLQNFIGYEIYRHRNGNVIYVSQKSEIGEFTFTFNDLDSIQLDDMPSTNDEVKRFAHSNKLTVDQAKREISKRGGELISRFKSLQVLMVNGILKGGRFLIISITPTDAVVFFPDSSIAEQLDWLNDSTDKVSPSEKLDSNWYYYKRKYPIELE